MNTLFGRLSAVVESHGGSVDKIIGDAIMALFGVPKAGGDDAERAVRCGLAIHSVYAWPLPMSSGDAADACRYQHGGGHRGLARASR